MKGEIRTELNERLLNVNKFNGLSEIKRALRSALIYSRATGNPYELTVSFYDHEHEGEETDSVVNGEWRKNNNWDIPKEFRIEQPEQIV